MRLNQLIEKVWPGNGAWYMDRLKGMSDPDKWFTPESDDFSLCRQLADYNLLAVKRTPRWENGSFKGMITEYKYNPEMKYLTAQTQSF